MAAASPMAEKAVGLVSKLPMAALIDRLNGDEHNWDEVEA